MKILDIALKDMTQYFRSLIALVMMFAVPILMVGMFYVMFGDGGSEGQSFEIPVTKVIIVNQDMEEIPFDTAFAGVLSENYFVREAMSLGDILTKILQSDEMADLMSVSVMEDVAQAKRAIDNQEAGIAVIVPANFSKSFTDPEEDSFVEFYQDPGLTMVPNIVKGVVQQLLDSFSGSGIALQVTFEELVDTGIPLDEGTVQDIVSAYFQEMFNKPQDQNPAQQLNIHNSAGEEVAGFSSDGMISMMMTGMTVFYVFFTGTSTAQSLLTEETKGTLPRLFTTPMHQSTILGGKFLSGVLMIIVQITVLMLFGYLVFQIEWGRLVTLLPIVISITLTASTFGIFLLSWARTERQAGLMIGGFVTIMGMLGMLPIFVLSMPTPPQIVFTLSHLVPQGWAVEGLQIAMKGGSPTDVIINSLVLLVWAALFFVIGVLRFRKRFA